MQPDNPLQLGKQMRLDKQMQGRVTVISLDGSLDSGTAPRVQQELAELISDGGPILLDLSRMSYMSSAGLRVLLLVYRQAGQSGARLALTGVPPDIHAVMSATGFLDFFTVSESVMHGVEALTA
jgi:anti-sigma B factor antagonist